MTFVCLFLFNDSDQTELLNGNVVQYFREKRFQEQNQKRNEQRQRNQIQRPQTLQKRQMHPGQTQQNRSGYPQQHQQLQQQPPYENPVQKFGRFMKFQFDALSSTR